MVCASVPIILGMMVWGLVDFFRGGANAAMNLCVCAWLAFQTFHLWRAYKSDGCAQHALFKNAPNKERDALEAGGRAPSWGQQSGGTLLIAAQIVAYVARHS